jgi:translation initiation factor 1
MRRASRDSEGSGENGVMSRDDKRKIPTHGGDVLGQNPFANLAVQTGEQGAGPTNPASAKAISPSSANSKKPKAPAVKNRGRVDIVRETGNRGGKTVTVITGFVGIGLPEKEQLAKKMRAACGCGGTVKDGQIELQGDKREQVAKILAEAGFRPVFAGG